MKTRLSDKLLQTANYVEYKVENAVGHPVLRKYYKGTDEWNEILGTEINKFEYDPRMYALSGPMLDVAHKAMKRIYNKADTPIRKEAPAIDSYVKGRGHKK
jgi:hypothetical protein